MGDERCGNCYYSKSIGGHDYACRRRAPARSDFWASGFPRVRNSDWCGDYKNFNESETK